MQWTKDPIFSGHHRMEPADNEAKEIIGAFFVVIKSVAINKMNGNESKL